ncbi:MAG TPA: monovalent cation/H(+) antiporter subunit G [Gemmatimonadaceae bacterium]|nr:monovalent cation/H(+) antiporter subunit G [Gemmatimonadaceae bacterium]
MNDSQATRLNGSTAGAAGNGALLDRGVERGIITAEQRDALLALELEAPRSAVEAKRGFNAVSVAYWTGGIAVLCAFAWFLISRWEALGPGGVLAVSLVYALLLVVMARVLSNNGFRYAAAVSTVLAVGMTPLVTWSVLALTGWWDQFPDIRRSDFRGAEFDWQNVRWLPIDLTTILAALIALRRVRYGVLALPLAIATAAIGIHGISLVFDLDVANELGPRLAMLLAVALLSIGYALDRRVTDGEDYAIWFYAAGLVSTAAAILGFLDRSTAVAAHSMLLLSVLFAVAALQMRRKLFLAAAAIGFLGYLAYLTFDVFRKTLGYPILLATSGLVIILLAVWIQRRFPDLQQRMNAPGPRTIPGAPLAMAGAAVIALAMIAVGISGARALGAERYDRERVARALMHNRARPRPPTRQPFTPRNSPPR